MNLIFQTFVVATKKFPTLWIALISKKLLLAGFRDWTPDTMMLLLLLKKLAKIYQLRMMILLVLPFSVNDINFQTLWQNFSSFISCYRNFPFGATFRSISFQYLKSISTLAFFLQLFYDCQRHICCCSEVHIFWNQKSEKLLVIVKMSLMRYRMRTNFLSSKHKIPVASTVLYRILALDF